jgi:hypothetical protein
VDVIQRDTVLHQPRRRCVAHDPRREPADLMLRFVAEPGSELPGPVIVITGWREISALARSCDRRFHTRLRNWPSLTGPPSGAVNTSDSCGRPAISADVPSSTRAGTGTTRWDLRDFGYCRRPVLVITSTTASFPRSQSTRWLCSPYASPGRSPTCMPSSISVRHFRPDSRLIASNSPGPAEVRRRDTPSSACTTSVAASTSTRSTRRSRPRSRRPCRNSQVLPGRRWRLRRGTARVASTFPPARSGRACRPSSPASPGSWCFARVGISRWPASGFVTCTTCSGSSGLSCDRRPSRLGDRCSGNHRRHQDRRFQRCPCARGAHPRATPGRRSAGTEHRGRLPAARPRSYRAGHLTPCLRPSVVRVGRAA